MSVREGTGLVSDKGSGDVAEATRQAIRRLIGTRKRELG